jgi:hypothetical protein
MMWLGIAALAVGVLGANGTSSQLQRGSQPYDASAQRRRMMAAASSQLWQDVGRRDTAQRLRHAWRR